MYRNSLHNPRRRGENLDSEHRFAFLVLILSAAIVVSATLGFIKLAWSAS